jgi:ATP-binding cassette, subfamily B, bacterial MsbA
LPCNFPVSIHLAGVIPPVGDRPEETDVKARPSIAETLGWPGYRRLWRDWLSRYRRLLVIVLLTMLVVAGASAAYAKLMEAIINAFETGVASVIWWGPLTVIAMTMVTGAGDYLRQTTTNRAITNMEGDLQKAMFTTLVGADLARLQTEAPAGLAARFSYDIGMISSAVKSVLSGASSVVTIIVTFGVMLTIDWPLTIGLILIFFLALAPVNVIGRKLKNLSKKTQRQISAMSAEVTEGLSGIRMARTYQLEEPMSAQAAEVFDRLVALKQRKNRWGARISPLMEILTGIAVAVLLFVVALRMQAGTITLAEFTGLLTGLGIASAPARRIGGTFASTQQGAAALDRVFMMFDAKNTIADGPDTMPRALGQVRFEDVGFAYPNGHVALVDFTLEIRPGTSTAFVGRSGAGKSTVFNLLPRLYDPTAGRILIDGRDIRSVTLASLREQIAVVSQDSVLLTGTVADNIGFGRRGAGRAEIEAAARDAAADEFIRALPEGYDTPVAPSASQFSGGERQRLSIARAILRDAPILLLDEPTSALDAHSEAQIRTALDRLSHGRTTLIIAHRLATILDADIIVVMEQGRIVEKGSHAELLALGGLYADLYHLQFAGQNGD